jgi:hypothetical protein
MEITEQQKQLTHEIQARIKQLSDLSGTDLKEEMDDLRVVLLKNPAACSLLIPEDLGMAVASIKRMVTVAVEAKTKTPATRKGKEKVPLSLNLSLEDDDD